MSYQARGVSAPGASRKRKDRDVFLTSTSTKPFIPSTPVSRAVNVKNQPTTSSNVLEPEQQPLSSNRLLAGYMAHEFLTKGTLFGQKFDSARANAVPVNPASESWKRNNRQSQGQPSTEAEPSGKPEPQSYAEVANLLKSQRSHIPGIVNPTQLARWIQM